MREVTLEGGKTLAAAKGRSENLLPKAPARGGAKGKGFDCRTREGGSHNRHPPKPVDFAGSHRTGVWRSWCSDDNSSCVSSFQMFMGNALRANGRICSGCLFPGTLTGSGVSISLLLRPEGLVPAAALVADCAVAVEKALRGGIARRRRLRRRQRPRPQRRPRRP